MGFFDLGFFAFLLFYDCLIVAFMKKWRKSHKDNKTNHSQSKYNEGNEEKSWRNIYMI